jgi:NAD(P)-dependent dehydrogenase (short-subunit alcohol dehydrogenase family)
MASMDIKSVVALVTGANRGIGRAIVEALIKAGAKRIYAGARNPDSLRDLVAIAKDRIIPLKLDVTKDADVTAAAKAASDVNVLINNAGVAAITPDLKSINLATARNEMDVNYFGTLAMSLAFAPVLAKNGARDGMSMIVNIGSIVSFLTYPGFATYCPTKHAVYSLSQSLRVMLAGQKTHVMTVHPGPIDTDMAKDVPFEKYSPHDVAQRVINGVRMGDELITTDPFSDEAFAQWRRDPIEAQRAAVAEPAEV